MFSIDVYSFMPNMICSVPIDTLITKLRPVHTNIYIYKYDMDSCLN